MLQLLLIDKFIRPVTAELFYFRFLVASVCIAVGDTFFPHPPFLTLCRAFISRGLRPFCPRRRLCRLTCPPSTANSSPPLAGLRRRGFAALRSPSSLSFLAALAPKSCHPSATGLGSFGHIAQKLRVLFGDPASAEPCSPFTSAPRRIPRFFTGRQSRANHHKYMVGVLGFEPRTSSLSGTRSNQLSYTPILDYRSFSTAESLMVESKGLEPSTSCLQSRCSSH